MQNVAIGFRTHVNRDQRMCRRSLARFAPREQVWTRSSHGILDDIGNKGCEDKRDCETKEGDVGFVRGRMHEQGEEDSDDGDAKGIDKEPN